VLLASQDDLDTRAEGGVATFADSAAPAEAGGGRGVAIVFASKPAREWDVEMAAHGLALAPGAKYRLSFWAKAKAERGLLVDISEDGAPWNALGFARRFSVGTTWTRLGDTVPFWGWFAIGGGVLFSLLIGGGLMALMFYSARHGYDDPDGRPH